MTSPTSVSPRDDNHRNASWLLSLRTKFLEGAGGYDGESRSRAAEEKPSGTAAPPPCAAVTEARRGHRPRLLPRQIGHGDRGDRRHRRGRSFVGTAAAIDGPTAPGGLWRSRWSGTDFFLVLLSGPPVVSFFDRSAAALF